MGPSRHLKEVVVTGKIKSIVEHRGTVYVNMYIAIEKHRWSEELAALFRPGNMARFRVLTEDYGQLTLREAVAVPQRNAAASPSLTKTVEEAAPQN